MLLLITSAGGRWFRQSFAVANAAWLSETVLRKLMPCRARSAAMKLRLFA